MRSREPPRAAGVEPGMTPLPRYRPSEHRATPARVLAAWAILAGIALLALAF